MAADTATPITNKALASDPDGDVVDELFQGFAQFLILENALKTDILDHLDNESLPVSVATLSTKYGYNWDVLERLLDTLVCMKLIRKHYDDGQWKYSNTRSTSVYLTKGSEFYKGDVLQADKVLVGKTSSSIIQTLRTGPRNQMEKFILSGRMSSINANNHVIDDSECETVYQENDNAKSSNNKLYNNGGSSNNMPQYKNQTMTTTAMTKTMTTGGADHDDCPNDFQSKPPVKVLMKSMDAMMYSCRHVIPKTFDLSQHRVAVDLGGGTGYLSRLLTDYYPDLTATVFELPHVVAMARSSQQQNAGNGRVSFVAGNFFEDDVPGADLYILSRVLHGWDETHCKILLNKIYRKLPPGGKLLILEKFLNERKDGPKCILSIHLNMSSISDGRERTAKEYKSLVEGQGFTDTKVRVIAGANLFDALLTCKPF